MNASAPGQYTISYRVADRAGHVTSASRKVTVGAVTIQLSDYTLFLLRDYSGGMDVKGKVAAGGNITMTSFSVGEDMPDNNVSRTLVAGGNLKLTNGSVWGEAFYGGSYTTGGGWPTTAAPCRAGPRQLRHPVRRAAQPVDPARGPDAERHGDALVGGCILLC